MKFIYAFFLLICVTFLQNVKSTIAVIKPKSDINSIVDWTQNKAQDAIDDAMDGLEWIKDPDISEVPAVPISTNATKEESSH